MKVKLNLNVETVKRAAIQHGEKVVFGLAAFILLWFLWKTVKLEVLPAEKQPDPLRQLSEQARRHVLDSKWDETTQKAKGIEVVNYPERAKHIALQDRDYPLVSDLDKPLWEAHGKRTAAKVFPVEELAAAAGECFLAVKREPGGVEAAASTTRPAAARTGESELKGRFFVAVTGVVPLRKQATEYYDVFHSALGYDSSAPDRPVYDDFQIERAEVTGNDANQLDWKPLDLAAVGSFVNTWAKSNGNDEVVDPAYTEPMLTMPLPSPLGSPWTPDVAGHVKIPPAERFDDSKKTEKETAAPAPETKRAWGGRPGDTASGAAKPAASAPAPAEKTAATGPKVDRKLFRFIDYFVEPGKQYRYRVKLLLSNPNFRRPVRELKEPDLAQAEKIETVWSEPSPAVTVPRGVTILAGPVAGRTSTQPSHDPEAEILVITFDAERGGEPMVKKQVQRGVLANFHESSLSVPSPDHTGASKWENVDIQSNSVVVDVQGGRRLSQRDKKLIEPVEVLVLDADGKLSVCDELDDAKEFRSRLHAIDKEKDAPAPKAAPASDDKDNPYKKAPPKGRKAKAARPASQ